MNVSNMAILIIAAVLLSLPFVLSAAFCVEERWGFLSRKQVDRRTLQIIGRQISMSCPSYKYKRISQTYIEKTIKISPFIH